MSSLYRIRLLSLPISFLAPRLKGLFPSTKTSAGLLLEL